MIEFFEQLDWLANLAGIVGFFVLLWTLFNVHVLRTEQRLANKRITLLLEVEGRSTHSYQIPGTLRRADFSRAEIAGRLGMIPLKDPKKVRYDLRYVQTNPKFLAEIDRIYNLKQDTIMTIPCTQEEFDQFKFG